MFKFLRQPNNIGFHEAKDQPLHIGKVGYINQSSCALIWAKRNNSHVGREERWVIIWVQKFCKVQSTSKDSGHQVNACSGDSTVHVSSTEAKLPTNEILIPHWSSQEMILTIQFMTQCCRLHHLMILAVQVKSSYDTQKKKKNTHNPTR